MALLKRPLRMDQPLALVADPAREAPFGACAPAARALGGVLLAVVVLTIGRTSPCASQAVSFELNVGAGFGSSSAPHGPSGGASADVLVGIRPAAPGFVVAVSGSGQAFGVGFACDVPPGGSCTPEFPDFWMGAALVGWETANGGIRALVGPALATSDSDLIAATQARLELAVPIFNHGALLASVRFAYIPSYRDESFRLGAVGIGVRLR